MGKAGQLRRSTKHHKNDVRLSNKADDDADYSTESDEEFEFQTAPAQGHDFANGQQGRAPSQPSQADQHAAVIATRDLATQIQCLQREQRVLFQSLSVDIAVVKSLLQSQAATNGGQAASSSQPVPTPRSIENIRIRIEIILDHEGSKLSVVDLKDAELCPTLSDLETFEDSQWLPSFRSAFGACWDWDRGRQVLLETGRLASEATECHGDEIIYGDWYKRNVSEGSFDEVGIIWHRGVVRTEEEGATRAPEGGDPMDF